MTHEQHAAEPALAAVDLLAELVREHARKIAALHEQLAQLAGRVDDLERSAGRVDDLETTVIRLERQDRNARRERR